ncbi:MAG TPA: ketopantoate reductase C-terminal domain-containing protein [Dermatophilaceae bacterium]|nr:ketopantoate reductase C-terminal domain-containing protein [Dermatophilaceae bacterium]
MRRATSDIETDYLNGEILLLGRIHGVATPANELLQRLARERAVTQDSPDATPAAAILERHERPAKKLALHSFNHRRTDTDLARIQAVGSDQIHPDR